VWVAIGRLITPQPLLGAQGVTIMLVAGVGIAINTVTALLFMRGRDSDLNIRGAFLHMAADALVSAGVVAAGALTLWMGWVWLDPVVSLVIGVVILLGTWSLFSQSLHMLFDGVPDSVDPQAVYDCLAALPGVARVHDLHIWATGTSNITLTAHLVMPQGHADDVFLKHATDQLHHQFKITHVTLQVMNEAFTNACADPAGFTARTQPWGG
jgi:cobalt-zinc-cadmium efflux system protein